MSTFFNNLKITFQFLTANALLLIFIMVFITPLHKASAQILECLPVVTSFKVTPTTLPTKNTNVNLSVTVRTSGCIIDGATNWYVYAEMLDQAGKYFKDSTGDIVGVPLPTSGQFKPLDFKRVNNNTQSPDYDKYEATYSVSGPGLSQSPPGNFFSVRPNLYLGDVRRTENSSQTIKITVGGVTTNTNTPGNTNNPTPTSVVPGGITDPFGGKTLSGVVTQVINILLALIVIAAVVVIIIAGFRMAAAGGNPEQLTKAKKTIIWAILGLVLAFMSFAIVVIIRSLL